MSTVFEQQMNFSNIIFKNEGNTNLNCGNCLSFFQFLLFVLLCDGANALCVCHIDTSMFCEKQELCEPGILVRSAERTGGTEDTVTESKTTQRSKH